MLTRQSSEPGSRAPPGRCGDFQRTAFTLIELLIVVAIIALLISLLIPSLKKAREQAKISVCLSHLKGITTSALTYALEDQHENLIPVHAMFADGGDPGAYDWGGKSGAGDSPTQDPSESPHGTPQGRGPATRPLNYILYKARFPDFRDTPGMNQENWTNDRAMDLKLFRCPSDRGYTGHHYSTWRNSNLSSYDHYGTSYCGNTLIVQGHVDPYRDRMWSISPFLRPLSRVRAPGRTVSYMENSGRFAWHVNFWTDRDPVGRCGTDSFAPTRGGIWNAPIDENAVVKGWHGQPFHFPTAYCDGHGAVTNIEGRTAGIPWNDPASGISYWGQCYLVRGRNWQLDAFPSPYVLANIRGQLTPQYAQIQ